MQKTPQLVAGVHRKGQPPRRICSPKCIFGATIDQSALEGIYKRFETSCDRRIALLNPLSPVNQPRTFGSDKCKPFVEFMGVVARIGCQVLTQAFATTTDMLNAA